MSIQNSGLIKKRQAQLGSAMKKAGLDAIVLNPGPSLVYLTGLHFHLSERPVICLFMPDRSPVILLPELELAKLNDLPYEMDYFTYTEDVKKWINAFKNTILKAGLKNAKVGVEELRMRFLELDYLQQVLPNSKFVNAGSIISELRIIKDSSEKENMQTAAIIAQNALEASLDQLKIGMTEKEFQSELVLQLFQKGSGTRLPFFPIVSSGPNSANPHAVPSNKKLNPGDLLVIDWGASKNGYFSDITRTFTIGEPNEEQKKIHQLVLDANQAVHKIAKPGVTCGELDKAARDVIGKGGYGKYFIHRTGHGLGMETHEDPYIRSGNLRMLESGMTFTIEPGIYIPGKDGVRIEDDVIVTDDGIHSFTDMDRELRIVG